MNAGKAFFDTNVLLYMHSKADPRKQALAKDIFRECLDNGTIVLSTQVVQEFHAVASRKLRVPQEALRIRPPWKRVDTTQWIGALLRAEPTCAAYMIHYYGRNDGPRTEAQKETLRLLAPHAGRALSLHQRLVGVEMSEAGLTQSLDRQETGRIIRMNRAAEGIFRRHDGLLQRNCRLTASMRNEESRLESLVKAALRTNAIARILKRWRCACKAAFWKTTLRDYSHARQCMRLSL